MSGRFEALHDSLALPCRLLGILRSIVEPFVVSMLESRAKCTTCGSVGTELARDHDTWDAHLFTHEPTQKPRGGVAVASALNQSIENEAVLVYGAPQPMLLAIDRGEDLVEMPFDARARSAAAAAIWFDCRIISSKTGGSDSFSRRARTASWTLELA